MAGCYEFGHRHRLALHAIAFGLGLCFLGILSPYWLVGEVRAVDASHLLTSNLSQDNNDNQLLPTQGPEKVMAVNIGLWWCCAETGNNRGSLCFTYETNGYRGIDFDGRLVQFNESRVYMVCVRLLMLACVVITLAGLLTIVFYCCSCCPDKHTLGYGLIFFVAGILGFAAIFIITFKVDVLLDIPLSLTTFGWSFPVFIVGNSIVVLASVALAIPISTKERKSSFSYKRILTENNIVLRPTYHHELNLQTAPFTDYLPEINPATFTTFKPQS